MKSPSFQTRFAALLVSIALLSGEWRNPKRATKGMFSGPSSIIPQSGFGQVGSSNLPGLSSSSSTVLSGAGVRQGGAPVQGGVAYSTQRSTSAAALAPPVSGMYLVDVAPEGGGAAGAGGLALNYAPPSIAIFPVHASGVDATGAIGPQRVVHHPVNWALGGTNIASGNIVFKGGLGGVTYTYSTSPGAGNPDISAYRAIFVTGNESGTGGTSKTVTFDAQPASAKAATVLCAIASGTATGVPAGNVQFPAFGAFQQSVPAQGPTSDIAVIGLTQMPPSNSITTTHTATTLGAATTVQICEFVWY